MLLSQLLAPEGEAKTDTGNPCEMKLEEGTVGRQHKRRSAEQLEGGSLGLFTRRACILIAITERGERDSLFNLRNDTVNSSSPARFIYIAFAR